ncbi:hypothetical protein [Eikenella corrodens]|uniref:hypothetical protein n=1 Tax=Eikenella corrodens TaxID=539 RepID=UPI0005581AAD|nr:hypothetical protein [Eikenella corrodens]
MGILSFANLLQQGFSPFSTKRQGSEKLFINYNFKLIKVIFSIYPIQAGFIANNSIAASEAHPVVILVFSMRCSGEFQVACVAKGYLKTHLRFQTAFHIVD